MSRDVAGVTARNPQNSCSKETPGGYDCLKSSAGVPVNRAPVAPRAASPKVPGDENSRAHASYTTSPRDARTNVCNEQCVCVCREPVARCQQNHRETLASRQRQARRRRPAVVHFWKRILYVWVCLHVFVLTCFPIQPAPSPSPCPSPSAAQRSRGGFPIGHVCRQTR